MYCNDRFNKGVYDKCMYVKDMNGQRIETGLDYLMGPKFCRQECYDNYHKQEHFGHERLY